METAKRDGRPLMVVRPADPTKALRIAKEALAAQDSARLQNLPQEVGADSYTFVGWLGIVDGHVLDAEGRTIGHVQPGDSFVGESDDADGEPAADV